MEAQSADIRHEELRFIEEWNLMVELSSGKYIGLQTLEDIKGFYNLDENQRFQFIESAPEVAHPIGNEIRTNLTFFRNAVTNDQRTDFYPPHLREHSDIHTEELNTMRDRWMKDTYDSFQFRFEKYLEAIDPNFQPYTDIVFLKQYTEKIFHAFYRKEPLISAFGGDTASMERYFKNLDTYLYANFVPMLTRVSKEHPKKLLSDDEMKALLKD